MSFKRTANGLGNQHLFHNVDYILYLEGGKKSYSKVEVYQGMHHSETEDIIFWRNIFTHFKGNERVKFKSVGSKSTVAGIAEDVIEKNLKRVLVAMDNEFDEILSKRFDHKNVYYPYGYSWENDCWNSQVIISVIEELTAVKANSKEIEINFNRFIKSMRLPVLADAYLFSKASSFFPKSGPLFCVECNPEDLPFVKKAEIEAKMNHFGLKKSTLYAFGRRYNVPTIKFLYGHLLADYCNQLIMHYLKKRHGLEGLKKDIVYRMGINKFFLNSFGEVPIYQHYESLFTRK